MGFTPQQVGAMSLYQFAACIDGYNRANNPDQTPEAMNPDQFDAMLERHKSFLALH